ncbi:MAG: hypothetical protein HOC18_06325 [Candidatus Marinimicrobia bacterium]|nr:hypothetical protein [Candidatus Neomarinimicrobiota bacterium]
MKTQVKWTKKEEQIIIDNGSVMLSEELQKLIPNHTVKAVKAKRRRLCVRLTKDTKSRHGIHARSKVNPDNLCKTDHSITIDDLDNTTYQVIIGSILGDGSIRGKLDRYRNFQFYECHESKQNDYVDWKTNILKEQFLAKSWYKNRVGCGGNSGREMQTATHPIFTLLRDEFYPERIHSRKQIIPTNRIEKLDELGLLIWYLDDGTHGRRKNRLGKVLPRLYPTIAAKGWRDDDLEEAVRIINKNLGLEMKVSYSKWRCHGREDINKIVRIPAKSRDKLLPIWNKLAEEHNIPECFNYKLR